MPGAVKGAAASVFLLKGAELGLMVGLRGGMDGKMLPNWSSWWS